MRTTTTMTLLANALALALAAPSAAAQDYELPWFTYDAGGDDVGTAGDYVLSGTIGQHDASNPGEDPTRQYINEGGYWPEPPLAIPPCSVADFSEPFGVLNFNDVVAFLSGFSNADPATDLSPPEGVFNFNDVITFLTLFAQGCP